MWEGRQCNAGDSGQPAGSFSRGGKCQRCHAEEPTRAFPAAIKGADGAESEVECSRFHNDCESFRAYVQLNLHALLECTRA